MHQSSHIHFIGVGGIGISALAFLALKLGKTVSGSDQSDSALVQQLRAKGATIFPKHHADNLSAEVDLVIYTEAISKTENPEYNRAKELNIPTISYFEALGELTRTKKTVVVAGTHGKTTTTAMLGVGLVPADMDPTVVVGSRIPEFDNLNLRIGQSELMVVEGCEYRRSFLNLHPFGAIITNCEPEHLDYYKDEADYVDAFIEFVKRIPENGFLVINADDIHTPKIIPHCAGRIIAVGAQEATDFGWNLNVPGEFNHLNALMAYKAAEALEANPSLVRTGISAYKGAWRRMEHKGDVNGVLVVDDYGHHPTEIKATLKALKERYPHKRLVCVFQPHQYSRTHQLLNEFTHAFADADIVIIPDIYEARDTNEDKQKIDAKRLVEFLKPHHPNIQWGESLEGALKLLLTILRPGDLLLTMGAGNINQLAEDYIQNK